MDGADLSCSSSSPPCFCLLWCKSCVDKQRTRPRATFTACRQAAGGGFIEETPLKTFCRHSRTPPAASSSDDL